MYPGSAATRSSASGSTSPSRRRAVAVTLRDGNHKFVRWDSDVYSTNVASFTGSSEDTSRLP
jgi:hypothetical protein